MICFLKILINWEDARAFHLEYDDYSLMSQLSSRPSASANISTNKSVTISQQRINIFGTHEAFKPIHQYETALLNKVFINGIFRVKCHEYLSKLHVQKMISWRLHNGLI